MILLGGNLGDYAFGELTDPTKLISSNLAYEVALSELNLKSFSISIIRQIPFIANTVAADLPAGRHLRVNREVRLLSQPHPRNC